MAVPLWTAKQMLKYLRGRYNKIEIVGIKKKKKLEHSTSQSDDLIYYIEMLS